MSNAVRLRRRMAVSDIKSAAEVCKLGREEIKDVLHNNFVPVEQSASMDELVDKLRLLWLRRQPK